MKSGFYEGNNIIRLEPSETEENHIEVQRGAIPETLNATSPVTEHSKLNTEYSELGTEYPEAGTIQETGRLEVNTAEQTEETAAEEYYPVYSVAGVVLDEDLQRELYIQLQNRGIEWWMPYGLMTAFQESGFNTSAVSHDGRDIGLFQFRSSYWYTSHTSAGLPSADIYNPYDQIYVYADSIEKKLSSGKDVATVISDHYTGGQYYDNWYVSLVLGWESTIYQLK